jgi:pectinesterase
VIANSRVTSGIAVSDAAAGKTTSLGRPWRSYSRVVFLNTELAADVVPAGWSAWDKQKNPETTFYAEYQSRGPGARVAERVAWSHQLTAAEAKQFEPEAFLAGSDAWNAVAEARKLP